MIMHQNNPDLDDAFQRYMTEWHNNVEQYNTYVKQANDSKQNSEEWHRINSRYKIDKKVRLTQDQMIRNGQYFQMQEMVQREKLIMQRKLVDVNEKVDFEEMEQRYAKKKDGSYYFSKQKCLDRLSKSCVRRQPLSYSIKNKEFIEIE